MKKVCIVGYGAIGPIHAAAVSEVNNAVLYAVCDTDQHKVDKCINQYGVKGFSDFDMMLSDRNIDSVHICTPHYLHYQMIEKALAAGKEVLCEKPVTMTEEEYYNLSKPDKVCVIMQNRFNPCVRRIKAELEDRCLGKIITAKAILTWHRDIEYYLHDNWRGFYSTEGGGVLINQAIHTLDLLVYTIGDLKSVKAQAANLSLCDIEVEDTVSAYLDFKNGAKGVFFATNAYGDDSAPQLEIICEKGILSYHEKRLELNGELIAEDEHNNLGKAYWGNGHRLLMKNYYETGEFFSASDIKNTMDAMFAIYKSADCGSAVPI